MDTRSSRPTRLYPGGKKPRGSGELERLTMYSTTQSGARLTRRSSIAESASAATHSPSAATPPRSRSSTSSSSISHADGVTDAAFDHLLHDLGQMMDEVAQALSVKGSLQLTHTDVLFKCAHPRLVSVLALICAPNDLKLQKESSKRSVAAALHRCAGERQQYARQFQRLLAIRLRECQLNSSGHEILRQLFGLGTRRSVPRDRKILSESGQNRALRVIANATQHGTFLSVGIDDYTTIQTSRSGIRQVIHMTTVVVAYAPHLKAIQALVSKRRHDRVGGIAPLLNPHLIHPVEFSSKAIVRLEEECIVPLMRRDTQLPTGSVQSSLSGSFYYDEQPDDYQRRTIFGETRNVFLLDLLDVHLHSNESFLDCFRQILDGPLREYLKRFHLFVVGDAPVARACIRAARVGATMNASNCNDADRKHLLDELPSFTLLGRFIPLIGPFHCTLNLVQTVFDNNEDFFRFVFEALRGRKLGKHIRPHVKYYMLEVLVCAWRKDAGALRAVLTTSSMMSHIEVAHLIWLLEFEAPAAVAIWAAFRAQQFDEFIAAITRFLILAAKFERKNYRLHIPMFLAYVQYWRDNAPEIYNLYRMGFHMIDESFNERIHSILGRLFTTSMGHANLRDAGFAALSPEIIEFRTFAEADSKRRYAHVEVRADDVRRMRLFLVSTFSKLAMPESLATRVCDEQGIPTSTWILPSVHGALAVDARRLPLAFQSGALDDADECDFCQTSSRAGTEVVRYTCGHKLHKTKDCHNKFDESSAPFRCDICFGWIATRTRQSLVTATESWSSWPQADESDDDEVEVLVDDTEDDIAVASGEDAITDKAVLVARASLLDQIVKLPSLPTVSARSKSSKSGGTGRKKKRKASKKVAKATSSATSASNSAAKPPPKTARSSRGRILRKKNIDK